MEFDFDKWMGVLDEDNKADEGSRQTRNDGLAELDAEKHPL